jgi:ketosteroid isomerase-like protein
VEAAEIVAELWRRIQARDWSSVRELLADEFVLEWPQELVQLSGPEKFIDFNRSYPEGWSIDVLRIVGEGSTAVSEVRVPHPTVGPYYALSFFETDGGRIVRTREYWVEEAFREPAGERARWFEPIQARLS